VNKVQLETWHENVHWHAAGTLKLLSEGDFTTCRELFGRPIFGWNESAVRENSYSQ
jgi:hypothetical protein